MEFGLLEDLLKPEHDVEDVLRHRRADELDDPVVVRCPRLSGRKTFDWPK